MSRQGCVCCPYPFLAIPGILSFIALVMTWVAAFNCNFYTVDFVRSDGQSTTELGIGLWTVESSGYQYSNPDDDSNYYGNYCTGYDDWGISVISSDALDSAMTAARVFSMMSCVLALIVFGMILLPACVRYPDNSLITTILVWTLAVLGGLVLLDLVALASSFCKEASECSLDNAGIIAIVSAFLWWICAWLMYYTMKHPRVLPGDHDSDEVFLTAASLAGAAAVASPSDEVAIEQKETKTVLNADGSTVTTVTTTTTNPDGSKTITQTTEVSAVAIP